MLSWTLILVCIPFVLSSETFDQFPVSITTIDPDFAPLEFIVPWNITGEELVYTVEYEVGFQISPFFGLKYNDSEGEMVWLINNDDVLSQFDGDAPSSFRFQLHVRFYPLNISYHYFDEYPLLLFYYQVKHEILAGEIYCSKETSFSLASYSLQVENGAYDSDKNKSINLIDENLLPDRFRDHERANNEWKKEIIKMWKQQSDVWKDIAIREFSFRDTAIREYLKIAQNFGNGVNFFDIKINGSERSLGVNARGLDIYETNDKLKPKFNLSWSDIQNISICENKFIVKSININAREFIFDVTQRRSAQRLHDTVIGYRYIHAHQKDVEEQSLEQLRLQAERIANAKNSRTERTSNTKTASDL